MTDAVLDALRRAVATIRRWQWLAPVLSALAALLLARHSGREDAERRIERDTHDHLIDRHRARADANRAARAGDARERLRARFGDRDPE